LLLLLLVVGLLRSGSGNGRRRWRLRSKRLKKFVRLCRRLIAVAASSACRLLHDASRREPREQQRREGGLRGGLLS